MYGSISTNRYFEPAVCPIFRRAPFPLPATQYTQEMNQYDDEEVESCVGVCKYEQQEMAKESLSAKLLPGLMITSIKEEGEDMVFELDVGTATGKATAPFVWRPLYRCYGWGGGAFLVFTVEITFVKRF